MILQALVMTDFSSLATAKKRGLLVIPCQRAMTTDVLLFLCLLTYF